MSTPERAARAKLLAENGKLKIPKGMSHETLLEAVEMIGDWWQDPEGNEAYLAIDLYHLFKPID